MPEVTSRTVNQTETRVIFDNRDVEDIMVWAAKEARRGTPLPRKQTGPRSVSVKTKLAIRQLTEDSPAYSVSAWTATVDIDEDHTAVAEERPK